MKIGALIVTTGLPRVSGVTALISEIGTTSAGQRMISAFQGSYWIYGDQEFNGTGF